MLTLYETVTSLLQQGIWVICLDEKTSIQAREGLHPPHPATAKHPIHVAARYIRQRALHLFAVLSVADGRVYGTCRKRKCLDDFQAFFLEVVVPDARRRGVRQIRLILDYGPTHAPLSSTL